MEIQLITREQLITKYNISHQIKPNKIDAYILRAQQSDLKPILGDALYYDLIENRTDAKYVTLLDGGDYTYMGYTIYFSGVNDLLTSFAYSRVVAGNDLFVTSSGNKTKTDPNSTATNEKAVSMKSQEAVSDALRIAREVEQFLDQNIATYPLYNVMRKDYKRTSFRITRI